MTAGLFRRQVRTAAADRLLQVFAKAPIAGQAKTRLAPAIGAIAAAQLHSRLVVRTLVTAVDAAIAEVELWCSPSVDHAFFTECRDRFGVALRPQPSGDLGARIGAAFADGLEHSANVIVIGSDCPALTAADLHEAFGALAHGADAVLGPAADGGYYLIGLRRVDARLFTDIGWGGSEVLARTRERLVALRWSWHELSVRCDVDRPEDLACLDLAIGPDAPARPNIVRRR